MVLYLTFINIVNLIAKFCDNNFPHNDPHKKLIKFIEDRKSHDFRYSINPSESIKQIGFKIQSDFKENLFKTLNYYLINKNYYFKIIKKDKWFNNKYDFND